MIVSRPKLEAIFRKVRQVQDEVKAYCLAPDRPDLPVEDFQHIVSQMYGVEITKMLVPFEGEFLRGLLERYTNHAVIYIKRGMASDWTRFVAVKEMCHIVNDEREDWSTDVLSTLNDLIAEYSVMRTEMASAVAQSELLAEVTAMELLYPFEYRAADLERLTNNEVTLVKIAGYHKMPAVMVSRALSPEYHVLASEIWALIPQ